MKLFKGSGYLMIKLCKDNKTKSFLINRLVAFAFIENNDVENNVQVNHKDENKGNNRVDNLEWCSCEYNINYGTARQRASISNSIAHKGKHTRGNHNQAKKVICNGVIYDCILDFCDEYDLKLATVSKWLTGVNKMQQRFIDLGLKYYEEEGECK